MGDFAQIGNSYPCDPGFFENPAMPPMAYRSAGIDAPETMAWWPMMSASADSSILAAKDLTLARVRDIYRNDANARAAVERLVDLIVGAGLNLSARPDGKALGIDDPKVLREFARDIQTEWRLFSTDPRRYSDVERRVSINGQLRRQARTQILAGESCYALMYREPGPKQPGRRYATCMLAVDPDRLSNKDGAPDATRLRGGVEMDEDGAPIAYHVRNAHIGDYWAGMDTSTWTVVPRETEFGRPIFVHAFEPEREGQTRAISPFACLVSLLRMVGKHRDHELATAAANALYTAFVESNLPVGEVAGRMVPQATVSAAGDQLLSYFQQCPAKVGGVRIPVMPPGSKISMNAAPRQTANFASFQTAFLQSIASALGLSYEQLAMDWSRTNYSSARAALNEVWRSILRMRAIFVEQTVMPLYYAFLEEAIDKGFVKIPASAKPNVPYANDNLDIFHAMPAAFLRSMWIGPSRGIIDPLKEAEATALELESLTTTLLKKCADQGEDYEETLDQLEIENQELEDRGLSRQSLVAAVNSVKGPKPDSPEVEGGPGGQEQQPSGASARARMQARLSSPQHVNDSDGATAKEAA